MKKLILLMGFLIAGNSFAYAYIGKASNACVTKAQSDLNMILEMEKAQEDGSEVNYMLRRDVDVEMTSDKNALITVEVEMLVYSKLVSEHELNETYTFTGKYDRKTGECTLEEEPGYSMKFCGMGTQRNCLK